MNLVINLLLVIICSIFIPRVKTTDHHCCPNNGTIQNRTLCTDGSNVSLACEATPLLLDPSFITYYKFFVGKDKENDGRYYLDAYNAGYLIHQPYFCTGEYEPMRSHPKGTIVALTCSSYRKWYRDVEVDGSEDISDAKIDRIFSFFCLVANIVSAVLLLMTAFIYYVLPNVQDVQGTCYFHFSLVIGLGHSMIAYMEIFESYGLIPNLCITNTYLLVYLALCTVCWSSVTCYHIWRSTMNYRCVDEAQLLKYYKYYGFGVPFALIFLAWVHVHLANIADLTFVLDCSEHQSTIYETYFFIPVVMSMLANLVMFIHSQIRIWNLHSIDLRDRKLTKKILKYRLFMNAKLFFIMGVPWILVMLGFFSSLLTFFDGVLLEVLVQYVFRLMIFIEGVPIFAILVLFRKRVLRSVANKWFADTKIFPDKWKTMKDSDTEEEVSDDETPSRRSPEAKYTANNNVEDKDALDESVIVNL